MFQILQPGASSGGLAEKGGHRGDKRKGWCKSGSSVSGGLSPSCRTYQRRQHAPQQSVQHRLARAAGGVRLCADVQPVLCRIQVEVGEVHHHEALQCLEDFEELHSAVLGL
ncbi:hypothetical protein Vafri_9650 [Volvox africanus]|uniref:Uncharacterized protein n=1 Tax=Volvox africanus TaxID=51714 RepID=A0A8J4B4U1_9CHLO|nr:hypothetical protein Vafri_9650 [Volvox africanus]